VTAVAIERADPPIDPTAAWDHIAAQLRGDPGESYRVRTCATVVAAKSTARDIRSGVLKSFRPAGCYDAQSSGRDVYAWYVGPMNP